MARKNTTQGSLRPVSRKHVSRAEREARQRQAIIIGTAIVALLVVLILGAGIISALFIEPGQAMAIVGDETITREEFYKRVNYERFRLFKVYEDSREQYIESLEDPTTASFMAQFFQQQIGQLFQLYGQIGSQTLETMIEEEIIRNEAAARNITVSDDEIDEEARRQIARDEGAQIEVDVTRTAEARVAATVTAESWTPTPEPTPEPTLEPAADITATESLTPTMTPFPTFTPAPTSTPYILTDETFEANYSAFISEMQERTGFTEEDFRDVLRLQILREKVSEDYMETVEVELTEEQVHAAHILVESEEEAQQVLERLDAGEAFEDLAAELSTDSSNAQSGGDLGWFARGMMVAPFEEAAFALSEPGEISEPVQSEFGYHIIKLIEGPEQREKDEATIEQEKQEAWNTYLQNARFSSDIQRFWDIDDMPADPFIDALQEPLPTPPPLPTTPAVEPETTPDAGEDEALPTEVAPPDEEESTGEEDPEEELPAEEEATPEAE